MEVAGTVKSADPVFGAARAIERRQGGGIEDMIAQGTTGLAAKPLRACFHCFVEVSSSSMISSTFESPVRTATHVGAITHSTLLGLVAFVSAFFEGLPGFLPALGFARTFLGG